jgi:glycosyltransferase involved in cell wall biosynthesis
MAGLDRTLAPPYLIVQLTSSSDIGGTERMVLELVARLDRQRFRPIVLSLVGDGALIAECRRRGIEAEHLDCRHPLQARAWRRFGRIIDERRVALVHLYGLRANLPGRYVARKAGAPVIVGGIRGIDPWRRWYHTLLDRWTGRWVNCFISNSEAGRRAALEREQFAPSRVVTIHSGIEERPLAQDFDRAEARRQLGLDPEANPVAAIVANIRPLKRHRDVIGAAAALIGRFPKIAVLCAGQDAMQGFNQRYAEERGVAGAFRWLGYVPDVTEIVAASDFLILPSDYEGLPASILEAMALGRTVIATPVGGVPEIVADGVNGLLVPPRSPDLLAHAIERLATDEPLRRRLEQGALETVRTEFSMDRMVEETERLYLDLIEGRRS